MEVPPVRRWAGKGAGTRRRDGWPERWGLRPRSRAGWGPDRRAAERPPAVVGADPVPDPALRAALAPWRHRLRLAHALAAVSRAAAAVPAAALPWLLLDRYALEPTWRAVAAVAAGLALLAVLALAVRRAPGWREAARAADRRAGLAEQALTALAPLPETPPAFAALQRHRALQALKDSDPRRVPLAPPGWRRLAALAALAVAVDAAVLLWPNPLAPVRAERQRLRQAAEQAAAQVDELRQALERQLAAPGTGAARDGATQQELRQLQQALDDLERRLDDARKNPTREALAAAAEAARRARDLAAAEQAENAAPPGDRGRGIPGPESDSSGDRESGNRDPAVGSGGNPGSGAGGGESGPAGTALAAGAAAMAAQLGDRLQAASDRVAGGGRLSPEERRALARMARELASLLSGSQAAVEGAPPSPAGDAASLASALNQLAASLEAGRDPTAAELAQQSALTRGLVSEVTPPMGGGGRPPALSALYAALSRQLGAIAMNLGGALPPASSLAGGRPGGAPGSRNGPGGASPGGASPSGRSGPAAG
ncbi:MAG TPA: hypothetical protein VIK99_08925, partial [Thermaerobacter sp.]